MNLSITKKAATQRVSPFKSSQKLESPGKTFDLTQAAVSLTNSLENSPVNKSNSQRRYASLKSRDIIKASKQELIEHLTSSREALQKHQQSSISSMRVKRLEQITMVTKGIKKGKLPPI